MKLKDKCYFLFCLTALIYLSDADAKVKGDKASKHLDDGLSEKQLYNIDDQPEACMGMIVLPNGESMINYERRTKGKVSPSTKQMKEAEERKKLPKSLVAVGGVEIKGEPSTLRRMTKEKTQIYDQPNGNAIDSYPKNFAVNVLGKKNSWLFITGYWSGACNFGWAQDKSLVIKSRKELEDIGSFGR